MPITDFSKISDWIAHNVNELNPPFEFDLIDSGRSNLTYLVTDNQSIKIILRHPPTSHVLPTAHNMEREYKIISSLATTDIPVPKPIAICKDTQVAERPFYLMSYVPGHIIRRPEDLTSFSESNRKTISENLVRTLADLHEVPYAQIQLDDLGKQTGYLDRQLKRWNTQYHTSTKEIGLSYKVIEYAYQRLAEYIPVQSKTSIVHGDFRLDNVLISNRGSVAAVLDWEICTLGDPLADLGTLLMYWTEPGDSTPALNSVTAAPGFATRAQLAESYVQYSGADLSQLPYYIAFSYWKLACILAGVYSRYAQGARAGDSSDISQFTSQIPILGELSLEHLDKL